MYTSKPEQKYFLRGCMNIPPSRLIYTYSGFSQVNRLLHAFYKLAKLTLDFPY